MRMLPFICRATASLVVVCAASLTAGEALVSVKASGPIALDGSAEAAWDQAQPLKIVLDKTPYKPEDYKGAASTEVTLRSVYDGEHIYFVMQYKDPTQSTALAPWVKQADGSWKQQKQLDSTGHDNTFYEDKFSIIWDINARGFSKLGCAVVCHATVNGKLNGIDEKSPGRKYTNKPGELVDLWHWKGVRTGTAGQVDDQFINDTKGGTESWGRQSDAKTDGGYVANAKEDGSGPAFMSGKPDAGTFAIRDEDKVPFADTFKAGDTIPAFVVKSFVGSRGDISAAAKWDAGTWTIEFKRKLVTGNDKEDVQFNDLAKTYAFGLAVFDNSQINHLYHGGALKLTFKP